MRHEESVDIARDLARRYYGMFLNSQPYWRQDLKAWGKTDEEILQEFIETAYWYGYMDAKTHLNKDIGMPEVELNVGSKPLVSGYMKYMIGNFRIDRDEYWNMTDAERQALHDKYNPGSKAMEFDMRFAKKHNRTNIDPNLLKEAIAEAKAKLCTELARGKNIIETFDGDYKVVCCEGPLSCSVAGGMTIRIKNKSGEYEWLYLPPGYNLERIDYVET